MTEHRLAQAGEASGKESAESAEKANDGGPGAPLMRLRGVTREFPAGDGPVAVLKDVDLTIRAGEMVAIVGPSGSGKSTLMNIIGCLDQPSRGSYQVLGRETRDMQPDELARLRREHFGFVFQRYQLLTGLTAQDNVEIPAIYAGLGAAARRARSARLLERLGLGERLAHKPGQLSGGQQQRVSIARALMNGGSVVLADEPTGALDSHTGEQVMQILQELNAAGHTIILVTHDAKVAAHARRVIEIADGRITRDSAAAAPPAAPASEAPPPKAGLAAWLMRLREAARMALHAMLSHRMRTLLTMLGIIIGIVSVTLVNAIGEGAKQQILSDISSIGTNTISIFAGSGFGDRRADAIRTLSAADAAALAEQPYAHSATPQVQTSVTLRMGNQEKTATVSGVSAEYFNVRGLTLAAGVLFDESSVKNLALDAVIDDNTRKTLFPGGGNPLGQIILLGSVPARIIGVTAKEKSNFGFNSGNTVWLPYTSVMGRLTGSQVLQNISVRVKDGYTTHYAEKQITELLTRRHGSKDFFTSNSDTVREMVEKTTFTMQVFISSIAVIALVVGGIGVMNIMLVSVTERTPEIGIRMAVGARQADILQQFLIEAVFVCLLGGLLGIGLAFGLGWVLERLSSEVHLVFSANAILLAVACSSFIGLAFGFWPARSAARLNPIDALSRQ